MYVGGIECVGASLRYLLCVRKPDGSFRVCMDARKLNELTVKDAYPVHNAQDNLEKLGGSTLFSAMDLLSGFWQINLDETSREKTAVSTPYGLFEHGTRMFGITMVAREMEVSVTK
eukprot:g828.t1